MVELKTVLQEYMKPVMDALKEALMPIIETLAEELVPMITELIPTAELTEFIEGIAIQVQNMLSSMMPILSSFTTLIPILVMIIGSFEILGKLFEQGWQDFEDFFTLPKGEEYFQVQAELHSNQAEFLATEERLSQLPEEDVASQHFSEYSQSWGYQEF